VGIIRCSGIGFGCNGVWLLCCGLISGVRYIPALTHPPEPS
jgi:hypothetical protein